MSIIATVQYGDYSGTAAADSSDFKRLEGFLSQRGVDTGRFQAIGASFYKGESGTFRASILCIDNEKSIDSKKHITSIAFENQTPSEEFFSFFKRFEVIILNRQYDARTLDIDEELMHDDR